MKLNLVSAVFFAATAYAVCNSNNCNRAVTGTQRGASHPSIAMVDCSSFFQAAVTPAIIPFYASACTKPGSYESACSCLGVAGTSTATGSSMTIAPNVTTSASTGPPTISGTVSSSSNYSMVSTSSSVTASGSVSPTSTLSSSSSVITASSSESSSIQTPSGSSSTSELSSTSSTSSSAPSSTLSSSSTTFSSTSSTTSSAPSSSCSNTLTDPNNCGTCGNVCDSGVCNNGACAAPGCAAATCTNFVSCSDVQECFCVTSAEATGPSSIGFCTPNVVCQGLTPCTVSTDCGTGSSGNICAVETCCHNPSDPQPGVCLEGICGNPAAKLKLMAKARYGRTVGYA